MSLRRVYETTIIINAALEDTDVEAVVAKITTYLENHGSVIEEINKLGRRRLAYPINKKLNGYYMHIVFNAPPSIVPILERFLVLEDTILRHLTLQLDDVLRQYRKEKSLAEGKSGETLITSVGENEIHENIIFELDNAGAIDEEIAVESIDEEIVFTDNVEIPVESQS